MSKKANVILFSIVAIICIFLIIFCLTYKKEVIQIEENQFSKNERLCEILDVNKQTVKYFVGDINYIEKQTYIEITKKLKDCNCKDTVIILPAGTIRFFNVPQEDSYAENTGTQK